ncbi:hypothetical protein TorRG33x02_333190, partial [Trema orientale]
ECEILVSSFPLASSIPFPISMMSLHELKCSTINCELKVSSFASAFEASVVTSTINCDSM